jgi:galactose mutarotase-like enzyme
MLVGSLIKRRLPVAPITLANADQTASLEVVPERGGLITQWSVQGRNILYLDQQRFANPTLSVRGGMPILFPICGNLPQNTYTDNGQDFQLKQHGFARDLPWNVVSQTRSELVLRLKSTPETLQQYPYAFQFTLTYALQGTTLRIQSQIYNASDRPLPFSLGFHPYFEVEDKTAIAFELPVAQVLDQKTGQVSPYTGALDLTVPELDVALSPVMGQQALLRDRHRQTAIEMTYDNCFSTLVVWTVAGKDYVCLEPWTGPRNALNTGNSLLQIPPQQTFQAEVSFSVHNSG